MRPIYGLAIAAALVSGLFPMRARAEDEPIPQSGAPPNSARDVNSANNPLTPKITVNLQDYFVPFLNRTSARSGNQFLRRGLVPSDAFGVPQSIKDLERSMYGRAGVELLSA